MYTYAPHLHAIHTFVHCESLGDEWLSVNYAIVSWSCRHTHSYMQTLYYYNTSCMHRLLF